ncbi:MAG: hypothetical protein ACT6Q9_18170, partial [Polaromonas sp.]|uniref:hypothetical protein n=1 Tax=Polaromonas sp. TaxID=1869339 RepID=UPI0040372E1F
IAGGDVNIGFVNKFHGVKGRRAAGADRQAKDSLQIRRKERPKQQSPDQAGLRCHRSDQLTLGSH